MHIIAAKAVAFKEALRPEFKTYAHQIIRNANALAGELTRRGYNIISGGTDNHLMLIDLRNKNITGKAAQEALDLSGITVNKNSVPYDDKSPLITSGIRIGTPALTSRGMQEQEMQTVASLIDDVLNHIGSTDASTAVERKVEQLCSGFPLYKEL
jgi:glycine hydroxymethyltransferase